MRERTRTYAGGPYDLHNLYTTQLQQSDLVNILLFSMKKTKLNQKFISGYHTALNQK